MDSHYGRSPPSKETLFNFWEQLLPRKLYKKTECEKLMPTCQLCGQNSDKLQKTKVEGAVLKVCDSCTDMGEAMEQKEVKKKRKRRKVSRRKDQVLASDYGEKVKKARESRKLSMSELADKLNEKNSLIKKVERGELKPDRSLASKLSKELEINLYVNPQVSDYDDPQSKGDTRKATLGDVAELKD